MIATSGFLTAIESAPNSFSAGALPRTPLVGGAYSAPQDPLAGLRGSYF